MIYLNNLKLINFETKIISDPIGTIAGKLSDVTIRIKKFTVESFNALYTFFSKVLGSLLPLKNNVIVVEKDELSLIGKLFEASLIVAENGNNNKTLTLQEEDPSHFIVDATYAYIPICNVGIPSLLLNSGIDQGPLGLLGTLSTISLIQQSCFDAFSPCIDKTFLKDNWLTLSTRDSIDHGLFLGALHFGGSILSKITVRKIDKPIHLALAIICTVSPIEERFFENSFIKQISETVHEITLATREIIKKPIKKAFKNYMISHLKTDVPPLISWVGKNLKISWVGKNLKKLSNDKNVNNLTEPSLLQRTLISFGSACVEHEIVEGNIGKSASQALGNMTGIIIEKISERVSDLTVDVGTSVLKYSAKGYLMNQALNTAYASNPLLTSLTMILEGGPRQDIYELSRRVFAVGVFVLTNSSFWPLIIINVPPTINYLIKLRKIHLKKQGFETDPLVGLIQKTTEPYLFGLKNLIGWTTNQEIKKMTDPDQNQTIETKEHFLKQPAIEAKENLKPKEKFQKQAAIESAVEKFIVQPKTINKGFFNDILGTLNNISH